MAGEALTDEEAKALLFLASQGEGWASYRRLTMAGVRSQTLGSLAFQDFAAERDDGWRITDAGRLAVADTRPLKAPSDGDSNG